MTHQKGFVLHRRQRATAVVADDPVPSISSRPSTSATTTRNRASNAPTRAIPESLSSSPTQAIASISGTPSRSPHAKPSASNGLSSPPTIPSSSSPFASASPTAVGAADSASQSSSMSAATIVGVIIMVVAVLVLAVIVGRKLKKRRKRDSAARAILQPYDEKLGQRVVSTSSHTPSLDRSSSPIPLAALPVNMESSAPETPFDAFLKKQREEEHAKKCQHSEWNFGDEARFTTSSTSDSLSALPGLASGHASVPPSPGGPSELGPPQFLDVPSTPISAGSIPIAYERSETGSINAVSGRSPSPTLPESPHVPTTRGAPGAQVTLADLIAQHPASAVTPAPELPFPAPVANKSFMDADSPESSPRVTSTSSSAAPPPYIATFPSPVATPAPARNSGTLPKRTSASGPEYPFVQRNSAAGPPNTTRHTLTPGQGQDWSFDVGQPSVHPRRESRMSRVSDAESELPYVL